MGLHRLKSLHRLQSLTSVLAVAMQSTFEH